ncbi:MAG: hypothetical protein OXH20_00770 [bacterium]|nr:hypothetical protein [bacterium]MDE0668038.1 hypothetical protein [bacterium]MXZ30922.1 hypothetical protein [Acidimicrobiia bacterium]MYB24401.1 hypothetical protein [Acidimicrobiia bacterium]MYJ14455.1 hypothetical protein [Acidimicrobiia bacterium]
MGLLKALASVRRRGVEPRADAGVISLFVAVLFVAFLLVAGVVIDSAELRGQRRALSDLARQAARAAVQEVDVGLYRLTGKVALDADAATAAARAVVARSGLDADVTIRGDRAAVALSRPVVVQVLGLGSGSVQISANAEARATWGVTAGR